MVWFLAALVQVLVIEHFTKHNLFHPNHHGSLAGHSTATAVIQLFDLWLVAAEQHVYRAIAVTCLFVWNALLQATERLAGSSLCHTKLWSEELGIEFSLVDIMM